MHYYTGVVGRRLAGHELASYSYCCVSLPDRLTRFPDLTKTSMAREEGEDAGAAVPVPRRPLLTPDAYSGESHWDDWIEHFESVATVNGWDDATKLLWIRVRLTGRAQIAWKRLPTDAKGTYEAAKAALRKHFEPDSKRDLYAAEFQTRRRRRGEPWENLADDLRVLADRAFPDLADNGKEQLALDRYLSQIDSDQVAFGVRQRRPKMLDEAVSSTLELESYSASRPTTARHTALEDQEESPAYVAAIRSQQDSIVDMLQSFTSRLEQLETRQSAASSHSRPFRNMSGGTGSKWTNPAPQPPRTGPIVCRRCGQEGHFARGCANWRNPPQDKQEN